MSEAKIRSSMPVKHAFRATTLNYVIVLCCNMSVPSVYETTYSLIARSRIRQAQSTSSLANVGSMNGRPLAGKLLV